MYYTFTDTPAGTLLLTSDGNIITGLHWKVFKRTPKVAKDWIEDGMIFKEALNQLDEYFAGKRRVFTFAYTFRGTDFQKSVWRELEKIPYGTYSSYQAIANAIGKPQAVRAVGTAVGSNPLSIVVPCHRVLTSSKKLGGYTGGIASKIYLLTREQILSSDASAIREI